MTEQRSEPLHGFEQQPSALLDHLVPLSERADFPLANALRVLGEGDAEDPASAEEAATALRVMCSELAHCEAAQLQARDWEPAAVARLEAQLVRLVEAQTPCEADERRRADVMARVGAVVAEGLQDGAELHVQPYGSFVSKLYTPNGDLDIALEGLLRHGNPLGPGQAVDTLHKEKKAVLLRLLCKKLERRGLVAGRIERILSARVPIIKFVERSSGLPCDMSVASAGARFKSEVLRALSGIDGRFAALVRLVKLWAGRHALNDATSGTFNSHALTLMAVFHLQTRVPAVLPPICALFEMPEDAVTERPLHGGREAPPGLLERLQRNAAGWERTANRETLAELVASFMSTFGRAIRHWGCVPELRGVRASTWAGRWTHRRWAKRYFVGVEDPFDATDNCARSIAPAALPRMVATFCAGADVLQAVGNEQAALEALQWLFEATRPPSWRDSGRGPPRPPVHLRREGVGAARPGASKLSGGVGWDADAAAPPDGPLLAAQPEQSPAQSEGHRPPEGSPSDMLRRMLNIGGSGGGGGGLNLPETLDPSPGEGCSGSLGSASSLSARSNGTAGQARCTSPEGADHGSRNRGRRRAARGAAAAADGAPAGASGHSRPGQSHTSGGGGGGAKARGPTRVWR
ncbi:hypothetical protein WJX81_001551 [Elliptochloris bilobata]|uniref:Poly(A) RNA polymerase mitochondrial-like central palm domain-containing protein n=1 Tax=Elliptochloris bilobata TaxID=381761 RepID=A0AAW1RH07_9CHLO